MRREYATHSRRLFYSTNSERFQLLSLSQRPDGSIYVGSPHFADCRWIEFDATASSNIRTTTLPSAGKLSIHGSGVSHVRCLQDGKTELRLVGHRLLDRAAQTAGVRHLLTLLPAKPPPSQTQTIVPREADCHVQAVDPDRLGDRVVLLGHTGDGEGNKNWTPNEILS